MSELLWSRESANARMRELEKERDELKRENARLKSEVEALRKAEGTNVRGDRPVPQCVGKGEGVASDNRVQM